MLKPIIAVDVDDVLAMQVEGLISYSNKTFGTSLTVDDYDEHWSDMWRVDREEAERRALLYHDSGVMEDFLHYKDAVPVLAKLSDTYELVIVTSRRDSITELTKKWVGKYYPGIFSAIYHAGIWDKGVSREASLASKAEVCVRVGASYLIDDQLKHCVGASEVGLRAILYGDYAWNQTDELPEGVVRCKDWPAVEGYFNER